MRFDPVRMWISRRPLLLISLCVLFGMIAGFHAAAPWWIWAAGLALSAGIGLLRRRSVFLFTGSMFLGALIMSLALVRPDVSAQDDVLLTGRAASEPYASQDYVRVLLDDVCADGEALPSRVMLYLYSSEESSLPPIEYGQSLSMRADLDLPDDRTNPYGSSYTAYLWQQGAALTAIASADSLTITSEAPPSLTWQMIALRGRLEETIYSLYSDETAPLISALLLGDRSQLSEETSDSFRVAGLSHLLAISGLHIACLALFLDWLLRCLRCPDRLVVLLVSLFLVVYAALVGFPASIVRAALMYTASSAARLFGRPANRFNGLMLALMLILLFRPLSLTDASFVLSFASVYGIMALTRLPMPRFPARLHRLLRAPVHWVICALCASLAAQLGSLPAMIYYFDSVSTYSPLSNLPSLPLMTLSLPVSMLSIAFGSFSLPVGRFLATPVEWTMTALTAFADWITTLPGALIHFPRWPTVLMLLYAAALFCCAPFLPIRTSIRRICLLLLPVIAALSLLLPRIQPESHLEITFLDVGQGDAAIVSADDRHYLIDAGEGSTAADYLSAAGITPDAVFLTHPHDDHAGGLKYVIKNCPPSVIYVSCLWNESPADDGIPEVLSVAVDAGWSIRTLQAGDTVDLSSCVSADVVQPWPGMTDDANGASLILNLSLGEASALFAADLPSEYEEAFFPDCDLLKVAHHGSDDSTSSFFLSMTTPSAAVISVGRNHYGHPSPETLRRLDQIGATVYRTDEHGTITARLFPDGTIKITPLINPESEDAA